MGLWSSSSTGQPTHHCQCWAWRTLEDCSLGPRPMGLAPQLADRDDRVQAEPCQAYGILAPQGGCGVLWSISVVSPHCTESWGLVGTPPQPAGTQRPAERQWLPLLSLFSIVMWIVLRVRSELELD